MLSENLRLFGSGLRGDLLRLMRGCRRCSLEPTELQMTEGHRYTSEKNTVMSSD